MSFIQDTYEVILTTNKLLDFAEEYYKEKTGHEVNKTTIKPTFLWNANEKSLRVCITKQYTYTVENPE